MNSNSNLFTFECTPKEGSQKTILNRIVLQSQKGLRVIFLNLSRGMNESMLAQKRMVSNEVRSISYQLHTLMLDDEVRRVPILSSWLVKQPPRNTLIIQKSQRGTRTLSPFPLLAHLNDATLAWSRPALRQICGANESLEDIPSQQTTQSGFFSTHLRNTSSHLRISLLNFECQRICSPLWS